MTQVMRPVSYTAARRRGQMRSTIAQPVPAFQLAESRKGNVVVVAQSPSGRKMQLGASVDPSGQYSTDFVPNEVGDWLIRILSDGQDIQGSPFHVRVFDPGNVRVHGLQGGCMGQPVNFAVDASCAGDGQLGSR